MGYIKDVPASGNEAPSASQPKITANFQSIQEVFNLNHTAIEEPEGGKHKFLTMPKQTDSTKPATGNDEGALYLKEVNSKLNLFLRQANSGTETNINLMGVTLTSGVNGQIVLNNTLVIKWGNAIGSQVSKNTQRVTFPTAFNSIFWVNFNVQKGTSSTTGYFLNGYQKSYFDVKTDSSQLRRYYYIAIGT